MPLDSRGDGSAKGQVAARGTVHFSVIDRKLASAHNRYEVFRPSAKLPMVATGEHVAPSIGCGLIAQVAATHDHRPATESQRIDKGKPVVRRGRKAMGPLRRIARLPNFENASYGHRS